MAFILRKITAALSLVSLLLVLEKVIYGECATLTLEQTKKLAALDAANNFDKGILIGLITASILANIWIFVIRKGRRKWVEAALLVPIVLIVELGWLLAEAFASECGNGGMRAYYYGYQLIGFLFLVAIQVYFYRKGGESEENVSLSIV